MLYHSLVPNPIPNLRLYANYIDASSRWLACVSFLFATDTDISLTVFEYDQVTGKLKSANPVYSYPMELLTLPAASTVKWQPNYYRAFGGSLAPRAASDFNNLLRFAPSGDRFLAPMYKGNGNQYAPDFQLVLFYHNGTSWNSNVVSSGNISGLAWSADSSRAATVTTTSASSGTVITTNVTISTATTTLAGLGSVAGPTGSYPVDMVWVAPDTVLVCWNYVSGNSSTNYFYTYTYDGTSTLVSKLIYEGTATTLLGSGTAGTGGTQASPVSGSTLSFSPASWNTLQFSINGFKGSHVNAYIGSTMVASLENLQYGFTGYTFQVAYTSAMGTTAHLEIYKPTGSLVTQTSGSFTLSGVDISHSPFLGIPDRIAKVTDSRFTLTSVNNNADGKDFRDYSYNAISKAFSLNPIANAPATTNGSRKLVSYPFKGNTAVVVAAGYIANSYTSNSTNFAFANSSTTTFNRNMATAAFVKMHDTTKTYTLGAVGDPIVIKPL
jgi:hypothetical protein